MSLRVLGQDVTPGSMWYGFTYPDSVHLVTEDINSGYPPNHYEGSFTEVGTAFSILNYFMSKYEGNLNNFVHSYDGQVYGEAWDSDGQPVTFIPGQYPNPTYHFCIGYWYDATHNSVHFFGGFQRYGNNAVVSTMHNDLGYHGMSLTSGPNDTDRAMASLYFFKPQELYQPDLTLGHSGDTTYYGLGEGYRCAVNGVYSVQKRRWELFNNSVTGFSADTPLMGPATLMTTQYFGGEWYGPRPSGAPMPEPDYYGWFYGFTRDDYPGYNGQYYDVTNMGDIIQEVEDDPVPAPGDDGDGGVVNGGGGGGRGGFGSGSLEGVKDQVPDTGFLESGLGLMYNVPSQNLRDLSNFLWSDDFLDNIKQVNSNAMDCIFNLTWMPIDLATMKNKSSAVRGGTVPIFCGNVNTRVNAYGLRKSYGEVWYKNINLTSTPGGNKLGEMYGTALDYHPNTTIQLYLPFIGMIELDPNDVFSPMSWTDKTSKISIQYIVNLFNGDAVAKVYADKPKPNSNMSNSSGSSYTNVIGQFECNIGFSIPLTGANYSQFYKNKFSSAVGMVAGGANALTGLMTNPVNAFGGMASMADSWLQGEMSAPQIMKAGSAAGAAAPMSCWTPYIQIIRPAGVYAKYANFRPMNGIPANNYCSSIGSLETTLDSSYYEFTSVRTSGFHGTDEEEQELLNILKTGVYINS